MNFHGGDDGQCDRNGAAAEAAEVINDGDFVLTVVIHGETRFRSIFYRLLTIAKIAKDRKSQFKKMQPYQRGSIKCMKQTEKDKSFFDRAFLPESEFIPLIYLSRVDEPEFGCEGRPDGTPVYGTAYGETPEGRQTWKVEECLLWSTGLDDDVWIGQMDQNYVILKRDKSTRILPEEKFHAIFG